MSGIVGKATLAATVPLANGKNGAAVAVPKFGTSGIDGEATVTSVVGDSTPPGSTLVAKFTAGMPKKWNGHRHWQSQASAAILACWTRVVGIANGAV